MLFAHLLTSFAVGQILALPSRRVDRLARSGELPSIELPGGELRYDPADIAAWIRSRRAAGKSGDLFDRVL